MLLTPELVSVPGGSLWACCSRATKARTVPAGAGGERDRLDWEKKLVVTNVLRVT